jgi:hypothetical protein
MDKGILSVMLRFALAAVIGILVNRGIIQAEQSEGLTSAVFTFITAGAGVVGFFVMHRRDGSRIGELIRLALSLPHDATIDELKEAHTELRAEQPARGLFGITRLASATQTVTQSFSWQDILTQQAISTVLAIVRSKDGRGKFARYLLPLRDALNTFFPVTPSE